MKRTSALDIRASFRLSRTFPDNTVVDGEIVALDDSGSHHSARCQITTWRKFDVMVLAGPIYDMPDDTSR
jgi:hypothetical protein